MSSTRQSGKRLRKEPLVSSKEALTLPKSQGWIYDFMQQLIVKDDQTIVLGDREGDCFGISAHAIQAMLLRELDQFDERLKKMYQLYLDDQISKASWEMQAFLHVIELLHQPYEHPDIFDNAISMQQSMEAVLSLVMSVKLEKIGGLKSVASFSGIYSKPEFASYLQSLQKSILASGGREPVALLLRSYNHAVSIGYDPIIDRWHLIDANKLSSGRNLTLSQLAKSLHDSFGGNEETALATKLYVAGLQLAIGQEIAEKWLNSSTCQKLHCVSKKILKRQETDGVSWLMLAAHQNHLGIVRDLIAKGADVNEQLTDGTSALFLAALNGHHEMVAALIEAGARVDAAQQGNVSPLFVAAKRGHVKSVEILLTANANINNKRDSDGATPLIAAIMNNQINVVKLLLEKGANPRLCNDEGDSPTLLAKLHSCDEIVTLCEQAVKRHQARAVNSKCKFFPFFNCFKTKKNNIAEQSIRYTG